MSATLVSTNVCALDSWAAAAGLSTNEDARIKRVAAACREVGADVIQVNELVTYQNAQVFAKAMGWGDKLAVDTNTGAIKLHPEASCITKGKGHAGVGMGFIWNPDVWQWFQLKLEDTYPGWDRNRWSLAGRGHLEGKRAGLASVHFEFMPKGPNNIKRYDDIRYEQMDCLLDTVKLPRQSWMVLGDQNHAPSDKPDAPGDAAKKHGMVNVDAGNIIRAQKTKDIQTGKPRMVQLGSATDHPMLVIPDVTVPV
jgi:hypothetical protein